jgi:hypothetical protein
LYGWKVKERKGLDETRSENALRMDAGRKKPPRGTTVGGTIQPTALHDLLLDEGLHRISCHKRWNLSDETDGKHFNGEVDSYQQGRLEASW